MQFFRLCVVVVVAVASLSSGCATRAPVVATETAAMPFTVSKPAQVAAFSASHLGEPHPLEWQPLIITRFKRRTDYKIVAMDGQNVLQARSEKAASGILQEVMIDPFAKPTLNWKWKVPHILPGADLTKRGRDDSPARLIIGFDGDRTKFDFEDNATANLVKLFSGREMPYATLMYVWDNNLPIDTLVDNVHSGRAKMIVVESGAAHLDRWLTFSRNIVEDFRRAFGEEPGKIISVGVMTDSNTTENDATAYYGDIVLMPQP